MLHENTLTEISTNTNTGVEYEIAMFYKLLDDKPFEQIQVQEAVNVRKDRKKIEGAWHDTHRCIVRDTG